MKKTVSGITIAILLIGMLTLAFNIQQAKSSEPPVLEWDRTYGGAAQDVAYFLGQTDDGGYALAGTTESFGAGGNDFWLIKVGSSGNMEWNQTYGEAAWDEGYSVIQKHDGGYAIAGHTKSFGAGGYDWLLLRTNSTGGLLWYETYGAAYDDYGHSVKQTSDGGYMIAGVTQVSSVGGSFDGWLVKTDSSGQMQWSLTFGEADERDGIGRGGATETADGGYALPGYKGGPTTGGSGDFDFWLIKLAPAEISATVDIDPDTLNLKSNGQWITAYITLPEGYSVEDVDVNAVSLGHNDFVLAADWGEVQNSVLMVKFDRATLRDSLGEVDVDAGDKFYDITLTVTGTVAGTMFEGSDTIAVKKR